MTAEPGAVVELRGIGRTFPGPPQVRALRACDLRIEAGTFIAITGPSGSGKSTLMNVLGLLDTPTEGTYDLVGHDVSRLADRDRASFRGRLIGFVFQAFHLVEWRTVRQNVAMGLLYCRVPRPERDDRVAEAIERVGLVHRADAPARTLSGGERQRVAIARSVVGWPRLLLCDEPTGNLDTANAAKVLDVLGELHSDGHTVVLVTHDDQVAAAAHRRVDIRDGRLSEVVGGQPDPCRGSRSPALSESEQPA